MRPGGTHKRWSLDGPREIDDRDVGVDRDGNEQLRLIYDKPGDYVTALAGFKPLVEPERWGQVQKNRPVNSTSATVSWLTSGS